MNLRTLEMLLGLLPTMLFLAGLRYMDSFKLVRLSSTLLTLAVGAAAALLAALVNGWIIEAAGVERMTGIRYIAPPLEEAFKALFLAYLLGSHRVGFMVDGAIRGFAIGTGFAFIENIYYWLARPDAGPGLWIVRGFGTALMHGGATAIVGIVAKNMLDRGRPLLAAILPGWLMAVVIHSVFNHFFLSPLFSTVAVLIVLPLVMLLVFNRSERATRDWLGSGFDIDRELLEMITNGTLAETKVGQYLESLERTFPGPVVADMLCMLRIHAELSIRAKGVMLMRDAGFKPPPDPAVKEQLAEMRYLEQNVGKTGLIALRPFMGTHDRDLWQMQMLEA